MSVILQAEHIWKQYRLGTIGTGTLIHDLNRWWHVARGKEDPYLSIGATNDRSKKAESDYVWALSDISFDVKYGEVLGIIGKNGAGKSTLLKILSRVTLPSKGVVRTKGRIASLLEVGTGFHPELTGRENIFLNGAILGMTKAEIRSRIDQIIDFSGCEMYIDTPVKRYSSGMRVRLGFAVAAHLEPEILVVDEVLAVGDAEFQKKAIGKMQDLSAGEGRTVLFVSHNMGSVKSLCTRGLVLANGSFAFSGGVDEAIQHYLQDGDVRTGSHLRNFDEAADSESFRLHSFGVKATGKEYGEPITREDEIEFTVRIEKKTADPLSVVLRFKDDGGNYIFVSGKPLEQDRMGMIHARMTIPHHFFNEGNFYADCMITSGKGLLFLEADAISFVVIQEAKSLGTWMGKTKGALKPEFPWSIN